MKRMIVVGVLCVIMLGLGSRAALGQQKVFLWGGVKWTTGSAAVGVEMRLVQGGAVKAVAYSNQAGQYAFFNVPGAPAQYVLQVYLGPQLLATRGSDSLSAVPVGGQIADI